MINKKLHSRGPVKEKGNMEPIKRVPKVFTSGIYKISKGGRSDDDVVAPPASSVSGNPTKLPPA
jgi:hypothetical protein